MFTHKDLARLQAQSLKMQGFIRQQTYSPQKEKTLRRFSSWEVAELILKVNQSTLRGRLAAAQVADRLGIKRDTFSKAVRAGRLHQGVKKTLAAR